MREDVNLHMTYEQARLVWIVISNHSMGSVMLQRAADNLEQLLQISESKKQRDLWETKWTKKQWQL